MDICKYNQDVLERLENEWLNPESIFFNLYSDNPEYAMDEEEKEEEYYGFSDADVEYIKKEFETDNLADLDEYDWTDILEELTGDKIESVKVDIEKGEAFYYKR